MAEPRLKMRASSRWHTQPEAKKANARPEFARLPSTDTAKSHTEFGRNKNMVRRLSSSRKWPLSLRAIRERLARDHIHTLVAHEDVVDGLDKGLIVEQLRIVGEVWLSSVSLLVCTLRAVRVCHCLMGSTHYAELARGRGWQRLMGTTQALHSRV